MIGNIRAYNDEIVRRHKREHGTLPYPNLLPKSIVERAESLRDFADIIGGIPYVGRERVRGFRLVGGPVLIDISGWGSESEPALTLAHTLVHIKSLTAEKGKSLAWGLTEVGQFQGWLQAWECK